MTTRTYKDIAKKYSDDIIFIDNTMYVDSNDFKFKFFVPFILKTNKEYNNLIILGLWDFHQIFKKDLTAQNIYTLFLEAITNFDGDIIFVGHKTLCEQNV